MSEVAWTVRHNEESCCYSVKNDEEFISDLFYARDIPEDQEQQRIKAHTIAAAPAMLAALEAVMYFWGRDPLAFGDEATINSLAGRFATVADQCRIARDAALGVES